MVNAARVSYPIHAHASFILVSHLDYDVMIGYIFLCGSFQLSPSCSSQGLGSFFPKFNVYMKAAEARGVQVLEMNLDDDDKQVTG
jgi:hypothetical protein